MDNIQIQSFVDGLRGQSGSLGFYHSCRFVMKLFPLIAPVLLFIDAPHGRAADPLGFNVNGNVAWFLMELVSPVTFLLAACSQPLSSTPISPLDGYSSFDPHRLWDLPSARLTLIVLFILHYVNRSIISTIRNPGRSRMHVTVPISAVAFNLLNGYLMGSWLSGRCPPISDPTGFSSNPVQSSWFKFYLWVTGWVLGFASNVVHDEVLYGLRRSTKSAHIPVYGVPHGLLYSVPFGGVSCPNYLSELVEWISFSGAAFVAVRYLDQGATSCDLDFFDSPPFLFFLTMVAVLVPRAIRTHRWYLKRFGSRIPVQRRAIIPGLL